MILKSILLISLVVIAYTYVGYPILLGLLCLVKRRPVRKEPGTVKSLSIVVCVHNGEKLVEKRIRNLVGQWDHGTTGPQDHGTTGPPRDPPASPVAKSLRAGERGAGRNLPADYEIVIASDGSTDETVRVATATELDTKLRILDFPERRGKAAVLNDVIPQCKGEIIVLTDVRQEFAPDAIEKLLADFADETVGAVSGELVFRRTDTDSAAAEGLDVYWRLEKALRRMESCVDSTNGCTGAIYAIRRELFKPIDPELVLDDVAIPMLIMLAGKRVVFESEAVAYDVPTQERSEEQQRKVRTLAGNLQLCRAYPRLLNPFRNRIWLQFVSHKLLRLVCPWLLIAVLAASAALAAEHAWARALLAVQGGLYALAILGMVTGWRMCGILSVPAAFLSLNWAALLAWFHFAAGRLAGPWAPTATGEVG